MSEPQKPWVVPSNQPNHVYIKPDMGLPILSVAVFCHPVDAKRAVDEHNALVGIGGPPAAFVQAALHAMALAGNVQEICNEGD